MAIFLRNIQQDCRGFPFMIFHKNGFVPHEADI